MDKFDIVSLPADKFTINKRLDGMISKGWVETSHGRALFKQAAQVPSDIPESRTDWSEKITAELAHCLKLPAAQYELAQLESPEELVPGSISIDLSVVGEKRIPLAVILDASIFNYDYAFNYEVDQVMNTLIKQDIKLPGNYHLPAGIQTGADMFVGVLMFDSYIGNTDRHDYNLEIVKSRDGTTYLSPVFDHGFSLGAVLDDSMRNNNSPKRYSEAFCDSSFSIDDIDVTGLEAFEEAAKLRPQAAKIWQNQLSKIDPQQIQDLFERIPDGIITPTSKNFAIDLLKHNQKQLLDLEIKLSPSQTQQMRVEVIAPILIDYLKLNDSKRVESDQSIVEFTSKNKTVTYQSKTDKEEYLSAQYADSQWIDQGSNISQSKESYFTDFATLKIKELKAKKLKASLSEQSEQSEQKSKSSRS